MARLEFATKGKEEKMELSLRLDKFLEIRKQNIGAKRAEVIKEKMIKGAKIGAKFAAAGWIFRDLMAPIMHTGAHSTIIEGAKKIIGEVEGAELPPLANPGEEAVRDIFLTNLREVAPLVHEHLPAAAMPHEHLTGAEINPAGYQGGHSIWQEGAKQLEHHYDQFKHLNKNLQNFDINRLKNAVAADPEKFGLPKNIDINKVTADNLKNVRWNEAMREVFGNQKSLGEKINNLHEVLSQHGKHVVPFKGRGAPLPEKIAPTREILPQHPAENIVEQNNAQNNDFEKVMRDMENRDAAAAPAINEAVQPIQPTWHRPSLGYQNTHAAENIAAHATPSSLPELHAHETIIENPNVGPDYAVVQPEKITGFFADFRAAEHLAQQPGDLDLYNVKSISFQALNALQNKTNGAIYLTGLDPEKITDKGILQGLSELRKNIHVVMQDSVARKIDGWETQVAEHQPDWDVDKNGAFVSGDDNTTWGMNDQGQLNQATDDANILTHHLAEQPATPSAAEHLAGAAKTEVIQPGQYNIPDGVPPAVFATEMRANPFAAIHKVKLLFADKYSFDQQKNISQYINTQIEERNELIKVLTEYGNKYDTKPKFLHFRDLMKQEILDENVQVAKLINGANNPAEDLSHAYVQMTGTGGPRAAAEIIAEKISRQANLLSPGDVAQNYFDQLPTHGSAAENIPVHQEVLNHPLPASLAPEKVLAIKNQVDGMYGKLRYADWTKLVNNSAAHKIVDNNQGVEAFITKNISLIQRGLGEMKATSDPSELAKLQEQIKDLVVMSEKKYGPILGIEKIYSDSIRTLAGL